MKYSIFLNESLCVECLIDYCKYEEKLPAATTSIKIYRIINIIRVVARRYERSKRDVTLNVSTLIITASFKSCQKLAT